MDVVDEESEMLPRPQINFDVSEENQVEKNERDEGRYKSLLLKEDEERLEIARSLVPEQMLVLQEVVKFCKTLTTSSHVDTNSRLRLIVHGGAGK